MMTAAAFLAAAVSIKSVAASPAAAAAVAAVAAAAAVGVEDVSRFRLFSRQRLLHLLPEGFAGKP